MKFSYYPGCSLEATAKEYDLSSRAVSKALGIELIEIPDWVCCGASSLHSYNYDLSLYIPAENLSHKGAQDYDIVTPCAACFSRLKKLVYVLKNDDKKRTEVENKVGFKFKKGLNVWHLSQVILEHGQIEKHLKKTLKNLKVCCYYGCLLSRPPKITEYETDSEDPQNLDKIITKIGATPLPWSFKTSCCGASLSLIKGKIVADLVNEMISNAKLAGAEAIVTACPLCQTNLEIRQSSNFPIYYFTELIGLALGLKETSEWFKRHMVKVHQNV